MSSTARARSVVLPIATLGELLAYGYEVRVYCPRCHQRGRPTIPAERFRRRFAGTRFWCHWGAPGFPSFRPGPHAGKRQGDTIADLFLMHTSKEPPAAAAFSPWGHLSPNRKP